MPPKPKPLLERLMRRVEKTETCWIWTGCRNIYGYGKIGLPGRGQGITTATHRLSYELHIGPIPEGMFVCHKCDNPPCCNPEHLFLGTQTDNLRDMTQKGRRGSYDKSGSNHPRTKLTDAQVRQIRELWAARKHKQSEIGAMFGIAAPTVAHIVVRRTWRHVE